MWFNGIWIPGIEGVADSLINYFYRLYYFVERHFH